MQEAPPPNFTLLLLATQEVDYVNLESDTRYLYTRQHGSAGGHEAKQPNIPSSEPQSSSTDAHNNRGEHAISSSGAAIPTPNNLLKPTTPLLHGSDWTKVQLHP